MTVGPLRFCPIEGHMGGKDCGCWTPYRISQVCDVQRHAECDLDECCCDCHRPAIERYGTPEHEAWLIEMEQREG